MAKIKSYTDLEQSKKLAKILPIESADYFHAPDVNIVVTESYITDCGGERCIPAYHGAVPCWSLSALLEILAKIANKIDDDGSASLSSFMGQWSVDMFDCPVESTDNYDNPIDACVEMIIHLHELNLL